MIIDDVFAVIAERTRREILGSLRTGDKAVGELVDELQVSQPTVSKHLKVLREAGLVKMRAQGQRRFYSLNPESLQGIAEWVSLFVPVESTSPEDTAEHVGTELSAVGLSGVPSSAVVEGRAVPLRPGEHGYDPFRQQQIGRTVGRAAERAAGMFAQLPKLRRRRD